MRFAVILVVLAACGRVGFDQLDADVLDADVPLGSFGPPQLIAPLSSPQDDDDPSATGDGLELYFMSSRTGTQSSDIFVSRRASRSAPWGAPVIVTELNSSVEDQSPGITSDGLTIYFSSRRTSPVGGTSSNIWVSTRASRLDAWSTPVFVAELSTSEDEFEPQPDASNLRLVLYRNIAGNRELLEATRAMTSAAWSTPVVLANVNAAGSERSPCLADGGLELWFGSDRAEAADIHDVYIARRASLTEPFGAIESVSILNTASDDNDPWLSLDGRLLLFASDRSGPAGSAELYEAQR
jgi:hypothetical protein